MTKGMGARIQMALELKGFSQGQLAHKSGVNQSHISMILAGKRSPGTDKLIAIARALDVSLDWLAGLPPRTPGELAPDEEDLLTAYRTLREAGRGGSVLSLAKAAVEELEGR